MKASRWTSTSWGLGPTLTRQVRVSNGSLFSNGTRTKRKIEKIMKTISLTLWFLCMSAIAVMADEEALPQDHKAVSPDGQYVLVMLDPERDWTTEDKTLRRYYPQSGLYKNDKSKNPLWTIDWHSFEVYLSSDGKHVTRVGPWPRLWDAKDLKEGGPALKQPAIAFYNEGKLLKGYSIGDLIKDPFKLPQSVSHFEWKKDIYFDDSKGQLKAVTFDGQEHIFDMFTGNIIHNSQDAS